MTIQSTPSTPSPASDTDAEAPPPSTGTMLLDGKPVPYALIAGTVWFDARAFIKGPMGLRVDETSSLALYMSGIHKSVRGMHLLPSEAGPQTVPTVSQSGARWLTHEFDHGYIRLRKDLIREVTALVPEITKKGFVAPIELLPNGDLPPQPGRFSGQLATWRDLRDSAEHQAFRARQRTERMMRGLRMANPGVVFRNNAATAEGVR